MLDLAKSWEKKKKCMTPKPQCKPGCTSDFNIENRKCTCWTFPLYIDESLIQFEISRPPFSFHGYKKIDRGS